MTSIHCTTLLLMTPICFHMKFTLLRCIASWKYFEAKKKQKHKLVFTGIQIEMER